MNAFSRAALVLVALAVLAGHAGAMEPARGEPRGTREVEAADEAARAAEEVQAAEARQRMEELAKSYQRAKAAAAVRAAERPTVQMPEPPPVPLIVVPTKELEPGRVDALVEDMEIMSHILQGALRDALGEEHVPAAGYGPFTPLFDGDRRQCLYLDGYGALFLLKVRPALVGTVPGGPEAPRGPESLWERAKQELHRPAQTFSPAAPYMMMEPMGAGSPEAAAQVTRAGAPGMVSGLGVGHTPGRASGPPPARRITRRAPGAPTADMVRDALLEALKEASNMRLEPDESIAVVVTGGAATAYTGFRFAGPGGGAFGTPGGDPDYPGPEGGTVLTIHVKKRDVDALAAGELDPEEFQERATIVLR